MKWVLGAEIGDVAAFVALTPLGGSEVTPPFEVDLNPDGTIKDKGCGEKKDDKTFGAPVLVDVVVRP